MTAVRGHSEWNQRVSKFVETETVACPDCGEYLPVNDEAARQAHYARCPKSRALSAPELKRLSELEVTISRGLKVFFEVGSALLEIRRDRLYRPHDTFEEYCQKRWQMVASRARQLISAAEVVQNLEGVTNVTLPANEWQAREYMGLQPNEQKALAALSKAVLGDKPTASGINSLKSLSQELLATGAITVDGDSVKLSDALSYSLTEEQHERMQRWQQNIAGARDARRAKKVAVIQAQERPALDALPQKFAVVYADPPWRYEYSVSESRAIENQYPTLALEDICALPVAGICTDDAVLFLWATSPKLAEAMQVIGAWDFQYRTCIVWDKARMGMGYYARQQHELLLIATRGDMPTPAPSVRPASVIRIERSETHSAKPPEFRALIERMYPDFQRIELFAREVPERWYAWGDEAHGNS